MFAKRKIFPSFIALMITAVLAQEPFPVSIIHLNDMHARFDESNMVSTICKPKDECIGGFARTVTKVKELLASKASLNPIYLNAADNFQGTLWYNIFKWNVISHFLNLDPIPDAMVINFPNILHLKRFQFITLIRQLEITSLTMAWRVLFLSWQRADRRS